MDYFKLAADLARAQAEALKTRPWPRTAEEKRLDALWEIHQAKECDPGCPYDHEN